MQCTPLPSVIKDHHNYYPPNHHLRQVREGEGRGGEEERGEGGKEGGRERCREDMNGRIIIFYFLEDKGTLSDEEKDECYMSLANCAMYQNDTELALKYYGLVPTAQSSWNQSQVGITLY